MSSREIDHATGGMIPTGAMFLTDRRRSLCVRPIPGGELFFPERLREQITLGFVATMFAKKGKLIRSLNAFRSNPQI